MDRPPLAARVIEGVIRLLYLGASLALVWMVQHRLTGIARDINQTGRSSLATWLLYVIPGILAGVMVVLAIRPFTLRGNGYRWGIVVALSVPVVFILVGQAFLIRAGWPPPYWLLELLVGGQVVLPFMLGIAIMAGFTTRT